MHFFQNIVPFLKSLTFISLLRNRNFTNNGNCFPIGIRGPTPPLELTPRFLIFFDVSDPPFFDFLTPLFFEKKRPQSKVWNHQLTTFMKSRGCHFFGFRTPLPINFFNPRGGSNQSKGGSELTFMEGPIEGPIRSIETSNFYHFGPSIKSIKFNNWLKWSINNWNRWSNFQFEGIKVTIMISIIGPNITIGTLL